MIQRIQTLYLALAVLFDGIVFFTPLYTRMWEDPATWISFGFATAAGVAMLVTLVSIFLYTNRPNQQMWVRVAVLLQFIALGFATGVLLTLDGFGPYLWDEALGELLLILALAGQLLAIRGIKKDEELVRSMDRIR